MPSPVAGGAGGGGLTGGGGGGGGNMAEPSPEQNIVSIATLVIRCPVVSSMKNAASP
jgi:hypothetical protein